MDSRVTEFIKKIRLSNSDYGRLKPIASKFKISEEMQVIIGELFSSPDLSKHSLAVLLKAVVAQDVLAFKFSLNDMQKLIDQDDDLECKPNLLNNSREVWRGLTAAFDGDLNAFKILVPSLKNGKKPAIVVVYNDLIWSQISESSFESIKGCFKSLKLAVPKEFDIEGDIGFQEYKVQVDRFLQGLKEPTNQEQESREQESRDQVSNYQDSSITSHPESTPTSIPSGPVIRSPFRRPAK